MCLCEPINKLDCSMLYNSEEDPYIKSLSDPLEDLFMDLRCRIASDAQWLHSQPKTMEAMLLRYFGDLHLEATQDESYLNLFRAWIDDLTDAQWFNLPFGNGGNA